LDKAVDGNAVMVPGRISPTAPTADAVLTGNGSVLTGVMDGWLANGELPVETAYKAATRRSAWGYTANDESLKDY